MRFSDTAGLLTSLQLISTMRFSDRARVQGKTGHLGSLPRTLTIRKRWQCENLSTLMWTHCDLAMISWRSLQA